MTTTASAPSARLTQKFNDGVSHAVTQILGILDTLDMAANAACADENYKKGVTMTLDKAAKALEKLHVTEIEALNQPFDPELHERRPAGPRRRRAGERQRRAGFPEGLQDR